MNKRDKIKLSSFMTKILRHSPLDFNIEVDEFGYCSLIELFSIIKEQKHWRNINISDIIDIVETCEKERFEIDNYKIKARYGHSFKIKYVEAKPPKILYHGTSSLVIKDIKTQGIKNMNREYVHLSETKDFATIAGKRKGELVLLKINTEKAANLNIKFYHAGNEVWLVKFIPKECIEED